MNDALQAKAALYAEVGHDPDIPVQIEDIMSNNRKNVLEIQLKLIIML